MKKTTKDIEINIEGYNLSTDYKLLWHLIQKGRRIPAWIVYSNDYEKPILDLVEVKNTFMEEKDSYSIGTRGRGYEGRSGFEWFEAVCEDISLHFVMYNNEY